MLRRRSVAKENDRLLPALAAAAADLTALLAEGKDHDGN